MKIIRVTAIILVIASIGVTLLWMHTKPKPPTEAELKVDLPIAANQFMKCVEADQIGSCFFEMTTDEFRAQTSVEKMTEIVNMLKIKLGDRISAAMMDGTFQGKAASDNQPIPATEFTMGAIYQNDATVKEHFIFVFDSTAENYKIQNFKINSSKF